MTAEAATFDTFGDALLDLVRVLIEEAAQETPGDAQRDVDDRQAVPASCDTLEGKQ